MPIVANNQIIKMPKNDGFRQRLLYFEHAQINDRKKQIINIPGFRSFQI